MAEKEKVILYYNPNSGNGLFKNYIDRIIERTEEAGKLLVPLRAFGDVGIYEFLADIKASPESGRYTRIMAAGGDGTINLCVNAMIANDMHIPLAVLPAGTANDFAYYFGIPQDIERMLDIALGDRYMEADVGMVNGRYFINVAAIGQVVDVSQKTDPVLKNSIGVLAYYFKGISEIPNLRPIHVRLITPARTYEEDMFFMVVMNGKSAGGFKKISPASEINDGQLDVILFRNMTLIDMPQVLMKIMQGTHETSERVLSFKTDELRIECDEDLPTDIDGEHGQKLPLEFSVLHNRLQVCAEPEADRK